MKSFFKKFNLVMVLLAVMVLPAFADIGQTAGDNVVSIFQQTVFPVLTAFFLGLVSIVVSKLAKKYNAEALVANNDLIQQVATRGIGLAEEMAAKAIKSGVDKRISGNDKLAIAVEHLKEMVPTITREQAVNIVEGTLAQISGAGATGEKAVTVQ